MRGDLAEKRFAYEVTRGVEAIVHCAGLAGTWGPYADYYQANVVATKNLIEGARTNGVQRVINVSSPSIYFAYKNQFNLQEHQRPKKLSNAYAQTKYEAEVLLQEAHGANLQTVSLRPRSVIGRGDQNILPRLVRLQKGGKLFQIGAGKNIVDITTVGNLVHAVKLCLSAPKEAMGEVYNITNGEPVPFWRFVEEVLQALDLPTKRRRLPYPLIMGLARANEFFHRITRSTQEPALLPIAVGVLSFSMTLDISKAKEKLGYIPSYTTQMGIAEFVAASKG